MFSWEMPLSVQAKCDSKTLLNSNFLAFLFQFEYQQAQLEAEIENLSWKIEHAETTDRGDLENQIDVAEKRRTSLLKDFLTS